MIDVQKYLSNFYKGNKNPSLQAMEFFMNKYNNFQKDMKFIHIAGTNGKGSITEMINNILVKQGYKVGKFISPHLIKYNERISINNKQITDKKLSDLIEELKPLIEEYNKKYNQEITLFELETTICLLYFYRNKVDFAILETGLGGLYDCTNIISNPICSIISSIGYDHMHILGDTLPKIAHQKAGIIKEKSNTICFEQTDEIDKVFIKECKNKNNTLHLISKDKIKNYSYNDEFQYFDYEDFKQIAINLKGEKQIENASISIECMKILIKQGYNIEEKNIRQGLKTVIHKARMETISKNPLIIFDGAHNEPAIRNLENSINMYYNNKPRQYIISILKVKDYEKIIQILLKDKKGSFIFTSGNDEEKYVSSKELYDIAVIYRKNQNLKMKPLEEAIEIALKTYDKVNLIVGSFYIYGDVINKVSKNMNNEVLC